MPAGRKLLRHKGHVNQSNQANGSRHVNQSNQANGSGYSGYVDQSNQANGSSDVNQSNQANGEELSRSFSRQRLAAVISYFHRYHPTDIGSSYSALQKGPEGQ